MQEESVITFEASRVSRAKPCEYSKAHEWNDTPLAN